MTRYRDEVEEAAHRRAQQDFGPLFVVPPVREAEQLVAPIEGTIQAKWEAWRASEDGERVMLYIRKIGGELVTGGATRLSAKHLVERARADLKVAINNVLTPFIARELDSRPLFHGLLETRQRKAS